MDHNCNDFIIRDGQFVRDFEGMYKGIRDPWGQNEHAKTDLFNSLALFHLGQIFPYVKQLNEHGSVLDAGCGFGNHAGVLRSIVRGGDYIGVDISATAIEKAKSQFEGELCSFEVNDLTKYSTKFSNNFDLIFSSKTLYYVGPEIDRVIKNLSAYLKNAGVLCFVYNQSADSFSNKWLTYSLLREKILDAKFLERSFFKVVRYVGKDGEKEEDCAIGVFQKGD